MTPRAQLLLPVLALVLAAPGCWEAEETPSLDPSDADPEVVAEEAPHRFLIHQMGFPWELEPGVVKGFDLDGRVSDGTHPDDCGWDDFTAPDGTPGIDNQMARMTPLFEPAGLGQAFVYLENSIEDSGFFLLLELRGVDDLVNDPSVELVYELGGGTALMDPNSDLVPHQTMCVQNDSPHVIAAEAAIEDGVLRASFDALTFTFSMFERIYPFAFKDVTLQARIDEAGFLTEGLVGGTLSLSDLMALVIKGAQNTGGLLEPMQVILDGLGDMHTDEGPCTAISAIMEFGAVPVFFFPPDSGCDPCGNDTCEYFESCETCLIDCCAGCGNGACEFYPTSEYSVEITDGGFGAAELDVLVGDTVIWTNQTDGPVNLACDDFAANQAVASGENHLHVVTVSGTYSCWIHEQPGQHQLLYVGDNHSETCESCPGDCGDCQ